MSKLIRRTLLAGGAVATTVAVMSRDNAVGRSLQRGTRRLEGRLRDVQGRLQGVRYRMLGRTPDPGVSDQVLADRIRSELGPLTRRLDVPRVHVEVDEHIAVLHGSVGNAAEARTIERFVEEVSGVHGVESYLHLGFASGDTRPSEGRARAAAEPSEALHSLLGAAQRAGADEESAALAVRAVLATFAERIPEHERSQLLAHLPTDVRELAAPPRRSGERPPRLRTVGGLVAAVATSDQTDAEHADALTESILGHLRLLVPEEERDVAAILPPELRDLWKSAVPG